MKHKVRVENGGLNLLHVSRCGMLHFVTSYMKKKTKVVNKLSRVRNTDWKSALSAKEVICPFKE